MSTQIAKEAAGKYAAKLVKSGMIVGLGTGSTAAYAILAIAERIKNEGLKIQAVATSQNSYALAEQRGIPLIKDLNISEIDITIDGADQIDTEKRMIKGGGGALLREKIVASISRQVIIVIDWSKEVDELGGCPLPLEIVPFAYMATINHIKKRKCGGALRLKDNRPFLTDNGNYIFDAHLEPNCKEPETLDALLQEIPGVIETGFFFNLASQVVVGLRDGNIEIRS